MVTDANLDIHIATLVPDGNGTRANGEDAQRLWVLRHLDPQTPNLRESQCEFLKPRDHEVQGGGRCCLDRSNEFLSGTTLTVDFYNVVANVHAVVRPRLIPALYQTLSDPANMETAGLAMNDVHTEWNFCVPSLQGHLKTKLLFVARQRAVPDIRFEEVFGTTSEAKLPLPTLQKVGGVWPLGLSNLLFWAVARRSAAVCNPKHGGTLGIDGLDVI